MRVATSTGRAEICDQFIQVASASGSTYASIVQASTGFARGLVSVMNPTTGKSAVLDPDSGFTNIGSTSGYNGTLAAAIADGKVLIGGIVVN
jgi:hypothetical protein